MVERAGAFVHFLAVRRQSQRQIRLHHPHRYWMQTKYALSECLSSLSSMNYSNIHFLETKISIKI